MLTLNYLQMSQGLGCTMVLSTVVIDFNSKQHEQKNTQSSVGPKCKINIHEFSTDIND